MKQRTIVTLKVVVWIACLMPLSTLIYGALTNNLGANPLERVTLTTGFTTLTLLTTSLGITPLRKVTGLAWLIRFRRLTGLFAFFYAVLHFITYIWFDKFFDLDDMLKDVAKRPFITFGFIAFLLLIPLAATSTAWSIRKLGGKKWNNLHRLVYVSAISGVVHFWWKVKIDHLEPQIFGTILSVLLGYRIVIWAWPKIIAKRPVANLPE